MDKETAGRYIEKNLLAIYRWSLSRLYDKAEAEDLAQDIIYQVLKSAERLENDEAFYGFLWKIAENTFKTKLRKKKMGYINSFRDIMEMETSMLKYTMNYLTEHYKKEIELLELVLPVIEEIPAVSFREAKVKIAETYDREIKDWEDFEPEEEKLLSELIFNETGSEFVFVTHYPSAKRPFYAMDSEKNPIETESFDLLFRGLEITTGGQRIHNYQEQIEKMQRKNMNVQLFESYLMMHKHGMPPHGGLGLGLERFTGKLLGYENVRFTTLFPRDINRLIP